MRFFVFQEKLHSILNAIITDEDNNEILFAYWKFDGHIGI